MLHPPDAPVETFADSSVLVTGGAGFIGSHLVDALAPVADVRVLDHSTTGRDAGFDDDVTRYRGDVTRLTDLDEATADIDHIFHLAALSSIPETLERPQRCLDVNTGGTAALLERARREDARLVFASSAAVYGPPESLPISEDEPMTPRSPYGISKAAADRYVRGYDDWFDVETVALRFFNVFGPRQAPDRGVVPAFVERARNGDEIVVHGDGSQTRDFVYVDDVVRALLLAASSDVTGEAMNVGTGQTTSISELATLVAERVPEPVEVVHDDPRQSDIEHSCADVTRAREALGFEASTTLQEGLASLLAPPLDPA